MITDQHFPVAGNQNKSQNHNTRACRPPARCYPDLLLHGLLVKEETETTFSFLNYIFLAGICGKKRKSVFIFIVKQHSI